MKMSHEEICFIVTIMGRLNSEEKATFLSIIIGLLEAKND